MTSISDGLDDGMSVDCCSEIKGVQNKDLK